MGDKLSRRRDRHDIIVEILQNAKYGVRKTHIMNRVNLSQSQNTKYLNALREAGFLTEKLGIWKTTEKGLNVIEACNVCRLLIDIA